MKKIKIENRRYIGSKASFLKIISEIIEKYLPEFDSFADVFAGTGVVSNFFMHKEKKIFVNDFLYSNFIAYDSWMGIKKINIKKINNIIKKYNTINTNKLNVNYFSKIYGNKYFSEKTARKIGYIRNTIEKENVNSREKNILLTSLMYETDRIANTVGHFEHYLKEIKNEKGFFLKELDNIDNKKRDVKIFCEDANEVVKKISSDVIYLDPPYNARQYINFYHVLENLILWKKPKEFEGKSMKFKRDHLKSEYSKKNALAVFKDLIKNIDAKLIILSYNNTYNAKSTASNNKIKKEDIEKILNKKGKLIIKEINYKFFNSGKTNFKNHKEFLYICKINNKKK